MKLVPYTYNGTVINDGTVLQAWLVNDQSQFYSANVETIERSGNFPAYAGKTMRERTIPVGIFIKSDVAAVAGTVAAWFDPKDATEHEFVCRDADESNKSYYVKATPVGIPKWDGGHMVINLLASDSMWRTSTEYSGTIAVSGTSTSGTITNAGRLPTAPTFEITPASTGGTAYANKNWIIAYNRSEKALKDYPLNITGGTLDSGTLIAQSLMQADGDDLRVTVNGTEVDRWWNGLNSGTTSVWINVNMQPDRYLVTSTAIPASGTIDYIGLKLYEHNTADLKAIPASGYVYGTNGECYYYGSKTQVTGTYRLNNIQRQQMNTGTVTLAAGGTLWWVEHEICMLYNNPTAEARDQSDDKKPMIDLGESTNNKWVWTEFVDDARTRTATWTPTLVGCGNKTDLAHFTGYYTGEHGTVDTDPASVMGMQISAWQYGNTWKGENGNVLWSFYHPVGGTAVSYTGEKYRYATSWPANVSFNKSTNGITWTRVFTVEATPGTAQAWTAITSHSETTIGTAANYFNFRFQGAVSATASNTTQFEIDDFTLFLKATETPVVVMPSPQANYYLDTKITNVTSGEYIYIQYPITTTQTMTVNCENKTVDIGGVNAMPAISLSSSRANWLNLSPGANVITYADATAGTVSVVVKWRERSL